PAGGPARGHWRQADRVLEPLAPGTDLDAGLRAAVADPVWFLTRQWQLGEHQGEDASSPVAVRATVSHTPLSFDAADPAMDPTNRPGEALVEGEPGDWWTIGPGSGSAAHSQRWRTG
ncbi:MAG: hypothetical protein M3N47_15170, partial [Chloroflexota bacterium]|nr:hypothetical protein [Chloroflexota bacterium]